MKRLLAFTILLASVAAGAQGIIIGGGGGGGSMTWPAGGAGIPNYNGSQAWGTSYNAGNPIPANFLTAVQSVNGNAGPLVINFSAGAGSCNFSGGITICTMTGAGSGGGSVTNVVTGTLPSWLTLSIATSTTTPTLNFGATNQSANQFLAGPTSGSAAAPGFRAIVLADLPTIPLTSFPTQAADSVLMNATGGSASPTAVVMPSGGTNGCAGTSNALTYNTSTHAWGCNTITGGGSGTVSGGTAGQLAVFGGATTITSGISIGNTGSSIPQLSGNFLASAIIPWANPGNIGSSSPASGAFTTLSSTGAFTLSGPSAPLIAGGTAGVAGVSCLISNGPGSSPGWSSCAGASGISGQMAGFAVMASSATTSTSSFPLDYNVTNVGFITAGFGIVVQGTNHGVVVPAGTAASGGTGTVVYASDAVSGFAEVNENNTGLSRICTSGNGVCATPGLAFPSTVSGTFSTGGIPYFTGTSSLASSSTLSANGFVLGGGTVAPFTVAGISSDGVSVVNLGVAGTSVGKVVLANATSGTITIAPTTGALGTVTATLPANSGTLAELNLAQTWSAAQTNSTNGAASVSALTFTGTAFTAGTGTTNTPLVYLNAGTAPTSWSGSGTEFGINTGSGFAGRIEDFHVNGGTSVWSVTSAGVAAASAGFIAGTNPGCSGGSSGFICATEGTAPTSAASQATIYPSSTTHEWMAQTNGSSSSGMLVRTPPGSISSTGNTASISTATLCAASSGACNVAGAQYRVSLNASGSGTACSNVTSGNVIFTLTWTDVGGTTHTAVPFQMYDYKTAAQNVTGTFNFNTALSTEGANGNMTISTNGTIVQYATTYTACTTGTGTYDFSLAMSRVQ